MRMPNFIRRRIEAMPLPRARICVISNCVINLVPDKHTAAYAEIFRMH